MSVFLLVIGSKQISLIAIIRIVAFNALLSGPEALNTMLSSVFLRSNHIGARELEYVSVQNIVDALEVPVCVSVAKHGDTTRLEVVKQRFNAVNLETRQVEGINVKNRHYLRAIDDDSPVRRVNHYLSS